ncbi:hypothetical protein [Mesorhizobium sp.]|uniref:hypothetical protein n=1 Tax=Mesorhizobium sp. TaxID=1871066 RepID=UPI000FE9B5E8|nr:hypothetical protein [Mesorhizobium sp.]RWA58121.1 MAG: hypothetical protein EOQ27_30710 [Mesorhizobium sp.]
MADAAPITSDDMRHHTHAELSRFLQIRSEVFKLMKEADDLDHPQPRCDTQNRMTGLASTLMDHHLLFEPARSS